MEWVLIIAVATLLVGIVQAGTSVKGLSKKDLRYTFINSPLLIQRGVTTRVKILVDDKEAQDIYLSTIKIANTGNLSVEAADYVEPITIRFIPKVEILSSYLTKSYPEDILSKTPNILTAHENQVILEKILLNKGDSITLGIIANQPNGALLDKHLVIESRIKGVKRVKQIYTKKDAIANVIIISSALLVALILNLIPRSFYSDKPLGVTITGVLLLYGISSYIYAASKILKHGRIYMDR